VPAEDNLQYSFALTPGGLELKKGADELGTPAAAFARAALRSSDDGPYTAAIALREGFDDHAFAAMRAVLAWSGRKTVVLGSDKGDLAGLNGITAQVACAYVDAPALGAEAIIVLPGGLYPDKSWLGAEQPAWIAQQAQRDDKRLKWVMDAYAKGATVVVLGYDGARLAGLDACRGLAFACPVHAESKFWGGKPGKRARDGTIKTHDRMYSAQGFDALGELLRLLEKDGVLGIAK
jgi:hypothetical protein